MLTWQVVQAWARARAQAQWPWVWQRVHLTTVEACGRVDLLVSMMLEQRFHDMGRGRRRGGTRHAVGLRWSPNSLLPLYLDLSTLNRPRCLALQLRRLRCAICPSAWSRHWPRGSGRRGLLGYGRLCLRARVDYRHDVFERLNGAVSM